MVGLTATVCCVGGISSCTVGCCEKTSACSGGNSHEVTFTLFPHFARNLSISAGVQKVFAKPVKSASYDVLKRQKERLEYKHQKELDTMKQEMDCLRKQMVEVQELLTEDWKKLQDTGGR